jgi:hypothetical protein
MPGIDLKQVCWQITIQQVLDLLNFVPTARSGPRLRGPCPIHGDSRLQSRIFSVNLSCHRYRCFRCRSAGTQLDLWAAVHSLSIYGRRGSSLPTSRSPDSLSDFSPLPPPSWQVAGSILAAILAQSPAAADNNQPRDIYAIRLTKTLFRLCFTCSAKRKLALLGSNLPRDSRTKKVSLNTSLEGTNSSRLFLWCVRYDAASHT